jgi:hypothetical protein
MLRSLWYVNPLLNVTDVQTDKYHSPRRVYVKFHLFTMQDDFTSLSNRSSSKRLCKFIVVGLPSVSAVTHSGNISGVRYIAGFKIFESPNESLPRLRN